MLWEASAFKGYNVVASDGEIGRVSDLMFEDEGWILRWLVVDVGHWFTGRKVMLPLSVFGHPDPANRHFPIDLTVQQIKDGPDVDTAQPISRQIEANLYNYYRWAPLPGVGFRPFGTSDPEPDDPDRVDAGADLEPDAPGDPHLRRIVGEILGYHIHATDGVIGHVEDLLVSDIGWEIRFLVVNTGTWWPGKRVLISPPAVTAIDWRDHTINLRLDRRTVRDGPIFDPGGTVDGAYDEDHFIMYGT